MWNSLRLGGRSLRRLCDSRECRRTFLSEAYRCTDAWNKRLDSSLLSKINSDELFIELDQKFQNAGKASAVDVDIYANVIKGPDHTDELIDVLHKLRLSPETSNTLDSTHHAVIRYLFDNDATEDLLTVLNDRMNYGIFPDHLSYNILMDAFIKKQDYGSAARVAVLLMLQEDSENVITNALGLYSCYKYLENPDSWKAPEPEPPEDPKSEEVKIRVGFIRNPFFDDHFDLQDPHDLVGKTLVFHGKLIDNVLGRTCHLRGLILWKKYHQACDLIDKWIKEDRKEYFYKEALVPMKECLLSIAEDKITDESKDLQKRLEEIDPKVVKEGSILEDVENRVRKAVEEQGKIDISNAVKAYEEWEKKRMSVLEAQLVEQDKRERLEKVDKMKEELQKRERHLTFFDKKNEIELQIEKKLKMEYEKYGKPIKAAIDADENYVPPEITKVRAQK